MNSSSPNRVRTLVGKKVVFLIVLALVALAYVATPLTAFAGGDGCKDKEEEEEEAAAEEKDAKKDAKKDNKKDNKASNSENKIIAALKSGKGVQFILQGKEVKFEVIKPQQQFQIKVEGQILKAQKLANETAVVTLPNTKPIKQLTYKPNPNGDGTAVVTVNSSQVTATLLKTNSVNLQFFDLRNNPLELSSLEKGDRFKIKFGGTFLNAVFLGNDKARVTLLPSGRQLVLRLKPLLPA